MCQSPEALPLDNGVTRQTLSESMWVPCLMVSGSPSRCCELPPTCASHYCPQPHKKISIVPRDVFADPK